MSSDFLLAFRAFFVVRTSTESADLSAFRASERGVKQKIELGASPCLHLPLQERAKPAQRSQTAGHGQVIFSRRFPSVERRLKNKPGYCPVPLDAELSRMLQEERVLNADIKQKDHPPVVALNGGRLWPLCVVRKEDICVLVLPVARIPTVSTFMKPASRGHAVHPEAAFMPEDVSAALAVSPGVTAALTFAENLATSFLSMCPEQTPAQISELGSLLKAAIPFGRFLGTSVEDIRSARQWGKLRVPARHTESSTIPCWKPHLILEKRKQQVLIRVHERIKHVSFGLNRKDVSLMDASTVTGTIQCNADVAGLPVVNLRLPSLSAVTDLRVHICASNTEPEVGKDLVFEPPVGLFQLATYKLARPTPIPFIAEYTARVVSPHQLLVYASVLLGHGIEAPFDLAALVMPFTDRGRLVSMVDLEYSPASIDPPMVDPDSSQVVWNFAPQFPNEKCVFRAKLTFDHSPDQNSRAFAPGEDLSCFFRVLFSVKGVSLSGLDLSSKDVKVKLPSGTSGQGANVGITVESTVSADFTVWNTEGSVQYTTAPAPVPFEAARQLYDAAVNESGSENDSSGQIARSAFGQALRDMALRSQEAERMEEEQVRVRRELASSRRSAADSVLKRKRRTDGGIPRAGEAASSDGTESTEDAKDAVDLPREKAEQEAITVAALEATGAHDIPLQETEAQDSNASKELGVAAQTQEPKAVPSPAKEELSQSKSPSKPLKAKDVKAKKEKNPQEQLDEAKAKMQRELGMWLQKKDEPPEDDKTAKSTDKQNSKDKLRNRSRSRGKGKKGGRSTSKGKKNKNKATARPVTTQETVSEEPKVERSREERARDRKRAQEQTEQELIEAERQAREAFQREQDAKRQKERTITTSRSPPAASAASDAAEAETEEAEEADTPRDEMGNRLSDGIRVSDDEFNALDSDNEHDATIRSRQAKVDDVDLSDREIARRKRREEEKAREREIEAEERQKRAQKEQRDRAREAERESIKERLRVRDSLRKQENEKMRLRQQAKRDAPEVVNKTSAQIAADEWRARERQRAMESGELDLDLDMADEDAIRSGGAVVAAAVDKPLAASAAKGRVAVTAVDDDGSDSDNSRVTNDEVENPNIVSRAVATAPRPAEPMVQDYPSKVLSKRQQEAAERRARGAAAARSPNRGLGSKPRPSTTTGAGLADASSLAVSRDTAEELVASARAPISSTRSGQAKRASVTSFATPLVTHAPLNSSALGTANSTDPKRVQQEDQKRRRQTRKERLAEIAQQRAIEQEEEERIMARHAAVSAQLNRRLGIGSTGARSSEPSLGMSVGTAAQAEALARRSRAGRVPVRAQVQDHGADFGAVEAAAGATTAPAHPEQKKQGFADMLSNISRRGKAASVGGVDPTIAAAMGIGSRQAERSSAASGRGLGGRSQDSDRARAERAKRAAERERVSTVSSEKAPGLSEVAKMIRQGRYKQ